MIEIGPELGKILAMAMVCIVCIVVIWCQR